METTIRMCDRRLTDYYQFPVEPPEVDLLLAWERYDGWEEDPNRMPVIEDFEINRLH